MGEGTDLLGGAPERHANRLEREIAHTRAELGVVLSELDRRRVEATDWRYQARRNAGVLGATAVTVALGIGLWIAWAARTSPGPEDRRIRARSRRQAFARAGARPREVIVVQPRLGRQLVSRLVLSFSSAASAVVLRRVIGRAIGGTRGSKRVVRVPSRA